MLAIMAVACVKHEITPEIKCEVDEVSVPVSGTIEEDIFVSFSSNVKWTAAIKEVVDWCQVTPESGEAGDAKVRLIVAETEELDPREVTLIITAGVATKEIKVVQGQVDAFELVTDSEEVGPEG
ncbi:MAG: BACON domain-containing protein, partial [Bacteroidales bacterium]|nr:BACON domain-containing protein [Bacteroidales bacterium]